MPKLQSALRTIIISSVALSSGCATTTLSQREVVETRSAMEAAEALYTVQVENNPEAVDRRVELYLSHADEELKAAGVLAERREKEAADRMLQRAKMDATYALAIAKTETSKARAERALAEVARIRAGEAQ